MFIQCEEKSGFATKNKQTPAKGLRHQQAGAEYSGGVHPWTFQKEKENNENPREKVRVKQITAAPAPNWNNSALLFVCAWV